MRAALYGRVSTEEQAQEGFSIAAQKEKLTAYARSQDWQVFDYFFDEGISGKHTQRPELKRMLAMMRDGAFDVVLVYRLDRLTRSVLDLYQLLQEFDQHRVCFSSATEAYDTTTAIGRLFITLVAALAQWERENLAERVKMGMEQMALEQKRPGGPPPFGFTADEAGGLRIVPQEAAIVREIFQWYAGGMGASGIARRLNQRGVLPKHGTVWAESTLHRMLRNHVYYGALRWNYAAQKGSSTNPPDKWILLEGVYEPILSKDTFLTVQAKLAHRSKQHPRQLASDFLFSGLLHCTRCGQPMSGKTGSISKKDRSYTYRFYHCKGKRTKTCDAPLIREDRLAEMFVTEVLANVIDDDSAASNALAPLWKLPQQTNASLELELEKLQARKHRWHIAYLDQVISEEELQAGLQRDRQQEELLRSELAKGSALAKTRPAPTYQEALELLQNLPLAWACATSMERKQLTQLLLQRLDAESVNRRVRISRILFH